MIRYLSRAIRVRLQSLLGIAALKLSEHEEFDGFVIHAPSVAEFRDVIAVLRDALRLVRDTAPARHRALRRFIPSIVLTPRSRSEFWRYVAAFVVDPAVLRGRDTVSVAALLVELGVFARMLARFRAKIGSGQEPRVQRMALRAQMRFIAQAERRGPGCRRGPARCGAPADARGTSRGGSRRPHGRRGSRLTYRIAHVARIAVGACALLVAGCRPGGVRERRLDGQWAVELRADSANLPAPARGELVISDRLPDFPSWAEEIDRDQPYAVGRALDDFPRPLASGTVESRRAAGPRDGSARVEVLARIAGDDAVEIDIAPRVADAGISLRGRIRGDSITGRWLQRAYCCGKSGTFTLWRVPKTAAYDSAVARGRRESAG